MDPKRFNTIFNRYGHIVLTQNPLPYLQRADVIEVPREVFVAIRNVRHLELRPARKDACLQLSDGGVDRVSSQDHQITIEGGAPWAAEAGSHGIRVLSARPLRLESLSTTARPDIAELLQDYRFVKSGFALRISSADGKPLRADELVLFAIGTSQGDPVWPAAVVRNVVTLLQAPDKPRRISADFRGFPLDTVICV